MTNCLSYALHFWNIHRDYLIWYNSDHCINIPLDTKPYFEFGRKYIPAHEFGIHYFQTAFKGLISEEDEKLLVEYFDYVLSL